VDRALEGRQLAVEVIELGARLGDRRATVRDPVDQLLLHPDGQARKPSRHHHAPSSYYKVKTLSR
jgi:hypothetical protein